VENTCVDETVARHASVDPEEVPGIFFVNQPLKASAPNIIDIAPTTLDLFGIKPPSYMEGRIIV
jgi:predicted AlkP superfamily phosphohydrolase/phosphomutase